MNKKNKLLNGNDLLTKQIRYAFSSSGNMEMDALVTVLALWHAVKKYFSFVHKRSIHSFNLKDWDRVENGRNQPIISNIIINISVPGN